MNTEHKKQFISALSDLIDDVFDGEICGTEKIVALRLDTNEIEEGHPLEFEPCGYVELVDSEGVLAYLSGGEPESDEWAQSNPQEAAADYLNLYECELTEAIESANE